TTIHRLRAFLAPHGQWIALTEGGYACSVAVHFVGVEGATDLETPLALEQPPEVHPPSRPPLARATSVSEAPERRVFDKLREGERASVGELAQALGLSESTILRALRVLLRSKRIIRTGHARATRYQARS